MAKLVCKDGTEIEISDETESSLRAAFGTAAAPKDYEEGDITVKVDINSSSYPLDISTDGGYSKEVSRNVAATEALIVALQKAVEYCKQHNLGV